MAEILSTAETSNRMGRIERPKIDAIHFPQYLMPGASTEEAKDLSSYFALSQFKSSLQEIYDFSTDQTNEKIGHKHSQSPSGASNNEGEPERGRIFYYDRSQGARVIPTEIVQGDQSEVYLDFDKLLHEGNYPLLPVHTHPGNDLPSPDDLSVILVPAYGEGSRMVKATMILRPQDQLLAVATINTPTSLDPENLERFVGEWDKKIDQDPSSQIDLIKAMQLKLYTSRNMSDFFEVKDLQYIPQAQG